MENPEPGFLISVILGFLAIAYIVYKITKTSEPPAEIDKAKKYAAAVELLKGGNAEEIAGREGISTEELEKWKSEFLDNAQAFAETMNNSAMREMQYQNDLKWFEKACEKHIGADWKDVTHYNKK